MEDEFMAELDGKEVLLLAGWANLPDMASVRVTRLEPETVVLSLEVAVVVAQIDNLGIAADAAVAVVVDGAVATVVATITLLVSVSGAWLEVAWMMVVAARLLAMAVLASTARLMLVVVAAVIVAVLEKAVAAAMLYSSIVAFPLAVLDMKAMEAEIAASFASRFSAAMSFFSNLSRFFPTNNCHVTRNLE